MRPELSEVMDLGYSTCRQAVPELSEVMDLGYSTCWQAVNGRLKLH